MLNNSTNALHQATIFPLPNDAPTLRSSQEESRSMTFTKGETVINIIGLGKRAFVVSLGSILIIQNGMPMDILEPGEYFDESIWLGAEAIAFSDCRIIDCSDCLLPTVA